TFSPRKPTRFGIDRGVPLYLRTMNAAGDRDWVASRLAGHQGGRTPDAGDVDRALSEWISRAESDLLLVIECDNRFLMIDLWDEMLAKVVDGQKTVLHSLQEGLKRGDGRNHTGYFDGISNLQNKQGTDPAYYRTKIYLPHPAPAYPGEPAWSRDDP